MVQTINWVEPTSTSVGSVLIYRASSNQLDSLGSRTILDTVGAKDNDGNWVTSYTDAGGNKNHIYRIRFWDGVGSSTLSDPIGQEYNEQLADFDNVLRLARLDGNFDLGSDIVFDAIEDATTEIFSIYGDPVSKTVFYINSEKGVDGQAYDFTGEYAPVYQIREIFREDGNSDLQVVSNNDYDINFTQGVIKFTDSFIDENNGHYVYTHWVPKIINSLTEHLAALRLHEGELIIRGADVNSPQVQHLERRIEGIKESIRPKGVFSSDTLDRRSIGRYTIVPQRQERTNLYFSH